MMFSCDDETAVLLFCKPAAIILQSLKKVEKSWSLIEHGWCPTNLAGDLTYAVISITLVLEARRFAQGDGIAIRQLDFAYVLSINYTYCQYCTSDQE